MVMIVTIDGIAVTKDKEYFPRTALVNARKVLKRGDHIFLCSKYVGILFRHPARVMTAPFLAGKVWYMGIQMYGETRTIRLSDFAVEPCTTRDNYDYFTANAWIEIWEGPIKDF